MAHPQVRVEGLRETQAAFRGLNKQLLQDFKDELAQAAEPVAQSARQRLVRFRGASTDVKAITLAKGVVVRQQKGKVTGRRGDFGALQMQSAFLPAAEEHENDIVEAVEDALERFANKEGF